MTGLKSKAIFTYPILYCRAYEHFAQQAQAGSVPFTLSDMILYIRNVKATEGVFTNVDEEDFLKFKGDFFEVFAEVFFKSFSVDRALGLVDYEPVRATEDYGVDAIGTSVNNERCAVQIKYKENPKEKVTYEDIAKTFTNGTLSFGLNLDRKGSIFVFTTANEGTVPLQTVFGDRVVFISRGVIETYIKDNKTFWAGAFQMVKDTFEERKSESKTR